MLKICKDKAINKNILRGLDLVVGNAEKLPFADNSFDYYTIAFGIRNMLSIEETLKEVRTALLEADVNFKVVKAFIPRQIGN